jgi:large subunit ribosomal protein L25
MSEDQITIEAVARSGRGKEYAKKIRREGRIPANIIDQAKSTAIELDPKWLSKAWLTGKTFQLVFEGKTRGVRIHELQINPVKRTPLHIDLMYI